MSRAPNHYCETCQFCQAEKAIFVYHDAFDQKESRFDKEFTVSCHVKLPPSKNIAGQCPAQGELPMLEETFTHEHGDNIRITFRPALGLFHVEVQNTSTEKIFCGTVQILGSFTTIGPVNLVPKVTFVVNDIRPD